MCKCACVNVGLVVVRSIAMVVVVGSPNVFLTYCHFQPGQRRPVGARQEKSERAAHTRPASQPLAWVVLLLFTLLVARLDG